MGAIDLKVPRSREGGSAGGAVFGRYKRRSGEIDDAMVAAYVHGASTRDIGQITEALMGERVSRSTVSRAAKTLGTKVEDLRKAPIKGPIPYLFLDAPGGDPRRAGQGVRHHLPEAPLQRCCVHLQRNVVGKAPQKLRARLAKAVWQVFSAPSKAEARKRMTELAAGLGRQLGRRSQGGVIHPRNFTRSPLYTQTGT